MIIRHRVHDYGDLVGRWKRAAPRAGLVLYGLAEHDGYPVFMAQSRKPGSGPSVFVSAGIHGDEPAGPAALIEWVERRGARLKNASLFLFPCLNPWGLTCNLRTDRAGRDLNRMFSGRAPGIIRAMKDRLADLHFDRALTMHEDYDAQGIYLYEIPGSGKSMGRRLLRAASGEIGVDPRGPIEGRQSVRGLICHNVTPDDFPQLPEAVWLHDRHSRWTATFETPSEFGIDRRIAAHIKVLDFVWGG